VLTQATVSEKAKLAFDEISHVTPKLWL